ncbi:MAG TPA: family 10 glycosylhydrolase [Vicinamibacterales bacterium]|nr:family 10 glycosylhydrolase [Vicinamibacterales bacterium]
MGAIVSSVAARRLFGALVMVVIVGALASAPPAAAQTAPEYRGYWVETFNTALGTPADIDRVIAAAVDSKANALFAQVRRRGDSWYLDSLEPLTQVAGVGQPRPDGTWTFDPLRDLIQKAHVRGIEVHAFVIVGSIYNAHPTFTGLPKDPAHVFNQHFWDKTAGALFANADPRQWSTRSLPHNATGTTFDGHRYGAEWYVDLGHPDAEAYTVDVLTHLVDRYDLDGLHLDRIRYPEAPIDRPGSALTTFGINVGYNETSVTRFKARHGAAAGYYATEDIGVNVSSPTDQRLITAGDVGYPRTNDPLWNDWRREQVSNFVRRLYLNVTAVKPRIKVSAALICFWTGPVGSNGWERTEAYYRVFQDWRSWAQEGTLDILAPMIYKREHSTVERAQFDDWLSFTKNLAATTGRHALPGLGAYLNGVEGTLRQARRSQARIPFEVGNTAADGVIFYALGNTTLGSSSNSTSAAVGPPPTGAVNPFAFPTAVATPKRTNAQFFSGVTTGRAGTVLFENPANVPLFLLPVATPDMPWKSNPTQGHVKGFARLKNGVPLDGAAVTITPLSSGDTRVTKTDGGGFYGAVGLAPGAYRALIEQAGIRLHVCRVDVAAGLVADAELDSTAPVTSATIDPTSPRGDNDWFVGDVRVSLAATDYCSGIARTEYSVDGGGTWQPYADGVVLTSEGTTVLSYRSVDETGNVEPASALTVRIDRTDPTITLTSDRSVLWPPNGQMVPVTFTGSGADSTSGLAGVTYQIVDEYGMVFSIAPRLLEGSSATWSDVVSLEARRDDTDLDGRRYTIVATVRDQAGRTASASVGVVVPHDRRRSGGR